MLGKDLDSMVRAVARSPYWRQPDAEIIVAALIESGGSLSAFCRHYGINRTRVDRWRKKLDGALMPSPAASPEFVPVRFVGPAETAGDPLEVVVRDHRVVVRPGFDADTLRRLVETLSSC